MTKETRNEVQETAKKIIYSCEQVQAIVKRRWYSRVDIEAKGFKDINESIARLKRITDECWSDKDMAFHACELVAMVFNFYSDMTEATRFTGVIETHLLFISAKYHKIGRLVTF